MGRFCEGDPRRKAKKLPATPGRATACAPDCWVRFSLVVVSFRKTKLISAHLSDRDVLNNLFIEKRVGMYAGVDPTAPSLHVGHMLPFMVLAWGYAWGLPVTFLVGNHCFVVGFFGCR